MATQELFTPKPGADYQVFGDPSTGTVDMVVFTTPWGKVGTIVFEDGFKEPGLFEVSVQWMGREVAEFRRKLKAQQKAQEKGGDGPQE